ncbi:hypothetical protein BG011_005345 [Mortierella polycephala]|uniref:Glutathione S-transferase n=1 Tax=Mortierella polycephala TaxID=41804 RepID=A0A9P6PVQ8_9FUNG|nr:hypothetical protein BG011_005345 [Mortierella polycephala]
MAPHPYFDPAQAASFNEISTKKDSTFELKYFNIHGFGAIARQLLASGGAKFTLPNADNWAEEKPKAPFGVMPLLKETSSDGRVIQIAETDAIERYLAKKFDFYGSGAFEEVLVNTFSSQVNDMNSKLFLQYFITSDPELKAKAKENFVTKLIPEFIKNHEAHLQANGANGHYVGNKTTLPDFKLSQVVSIIQSISGEDLVSEKLTPAIFKVKTEVDKIPGLVAWKQTEEFKALSKANFDRLGYY